MHCDPITLFHEKPFRQRVGEDLLLIAQAADALPDSELAGSDDEALAGRVIHAGDSMDLDRSDYDRIVAEGVQICIEYRDGDGSPVAVWKTRWYSGYELLHIDPSKRGGKVRGWVTVDMETIPTVHIVGHGETEEEASNACRLQVLRFHKYVRALVRRIEEHDERCFDAALKFVRNRRNGIRNIPDFENIAA